MPWGAGRAQQLYAPTGADSEPARTGARWLVLAEVDTEALQAAVAQPAPAFNPFAGDAGRLLDNMLRAAGLNQALSVHLVPLARHWQAPPHVPAQTSAADAPVQLLDDLAVAMSGWAETLAPDVVLVMGRFAAQALLPTELPFGKLRGQVHALYGTPVVVTYDAGCLLRYQADKAKAWDDLRLAMGVARQAAG
ncbi:MAG: phage polymerase-related protein [Polaromonas sp.]|nr:phage polymerase-related protein [Polaromonas sp.]